MWFDWRLPIENDSGSLLFPAMSMYRAQATSEWGRLICSTNQFLHLPAVTALEGDSISKQDVETVISRSACYGLRSFHCNIFPVKTQRRSCVGNCRLKSRLWSLARSASHEYEYKWRISESPLKQRPTCTTICIFIALTPRWRNWMVLSTWTCSIQSKESLTKSRNSSEKRGFISTRLSWTTWSLRIFRRWWLLRKLLTIESSRIHQKRTCSLF